MKAGKIARLCLWAAALGLTIFVCHVSKRLVAFTNSYIVFEHCEQRVPLIDLIRFAAYLDTPESYESCIAKLKHLETAKDMWTADHNAHDGDVITWKDVEPYLGRGTQAGRDLCWCPQGGIYRLGRVGEIPTCSLTNHTWR